MIWECTASSPTPQTEQAKEQSRTNVIGTPETGISKDPRHDYFPSLWCAFLQLPFVSALAGRTENLRSGVALVHCRELAYPMSANRMGASDFSLYIYDIQHGCWLALSNYFERKRAKRSRGFGVSSYPDHVPKIVRPRMYRSTAERNCNSGDSMNREARRTEKSALFFANGPLLHKLHD